MAKHSPKHKSKTKSKGAPSSATSLTHPVDTSVLDEKINPITKWLPMALLPLGAIGAAEIWDWRGGTVWVVILFTFLAAWRFMLQISHPNDPGAAS